MEQQAYSVFITSSYSYIPYLYSEQHYQKVALAENAISLRYILGPIIESIYMQQVPFITFIILSIFYGYQVHYSKFQNNKKECEIDMIEINFHSQHSEPQLEQPQSYFKVLKQYNVYINALIFAMVTTSIISIFHQWHNIQSTSRILYRIATYVLYNSHYFDYKNLKYKQTIVYDKILTFKWNTIIFYGPNHTFTGIDRNLLICCISLAINGISQSFLYQLKYTIQFIYIFQLNQMNLLIELYPNQVKQFNNFGQQYSLPLFNWINSRVLSLVDFYQIYVCDLDRIASISGLLALILHSIFIKTFEKIDYDFYYSF
ncbi:unnamed protein product [Paramecium sonneborni]|uniref:Uncharacterized protein n=1 Tax=Paramecium sonneborni TaxID=65129 RepID=A0A8S1K6F6_9CILI|nr:unnamed protein product [Paramecium sonneborni]